MNAGFDGVLVIAFGGPGSLDEVRPFLQRVLKGRPVPQARFDEVVNHYELIGGRSPLPEITRRQVEALRAELRARGLALPVELGMRNSAPFLREALAALSAAGSKRVLGVIMAAHEGPASHGRYKQAVAEACAELEAAAPELAYASGFHTHPGFVAAHVDHVRAALARVPEGFPAKLVFTAHSVPVAAARPYADQITQSCALIAQALGRGDYRVAYQSRSGAPGDAWLEPDVNAVLREEAAAGTRVVVLSPVGFLCDHVEVLYDLDVEAAATARALGLTLVRAASPNDHPGLIEALVDRILESR